MEIKGILFDMFKAFLPDILTEVWSIRKIKDAIGKGSLEETDKEKSYKFNDDTGFIAVLSKLGTEPKCAGYPKIIIDFINNNLKEDQQKKFRNRVNLLSRKEEQKKVGEKTEPVKDEHGNQKKDKKGNLLTKQVPIMVTTNAGLDFLKVLTKLPTDDDRLAFCETSDIMNSPQESLQKATKKIISMRKDIRKKYCIKKPLPRKPATNIVGKVWGKIWY